MTDLLTCQGVERERERVTVVQNDYVYCINLPVGEVVDGKDMSLPMRYTVVDGEVYIEPHNFVKWLTGGAQVCSCLALSMNCALSQSSSIVIFELLSLSQVSCCIKRIKHATSVVIKHALRWHAPRTTSSAST